MEGFAKVLDMSTNCSKCQPLELQWLQGQYMFINRRSGQGHPLCSQSKVEASTKWLCLTTMTMNKVNSIT